MPLPKIDHPVFSLNLPSNGKEIKFRPFLVREEKILLMAKESSNSKDMVEAVRQIIKNCIIEPKDLDVSALPTFDIEYFFVKLRARSVNNIVNLSYRDLEDNKIYDFDVNLDEVQVKRIEGHTNKIKINDKLGVVLRYPTTDIYTKVNFAEDQDASVGTIRWCLDSVFDEENVYLIKDYTPQEVDEFIFDLDVEALNGIMEFIRTIPKLHYEIKYKNSLGNEKTIVLDSLSDFFTLG